MAPTPSPGRQKIEKIYGKRIQNTKDIKKNNKNIEKIQKYTKISKKPKNFLS